MHRPIKNAYILLLTMILTRTTISVALNKKSAQKQKVKEGKPFLASGFPTKTIPTDKPKTSNHRTTPKLKIGVVFM